MYVYYKYKIPKQLLLSAIPSPSLQMHNNKIILNYKQILRTYMLRMLALSQQSPKFALMHPIEELDQYFNKFLHGQSIKESYLYQLTNVEIKSDQHCLLVMTLLYDLSKWVYQTVNFAITEVTTKITKVAIHKPKNMAQYCQKQLYNQLTQCIIEPTTVQCLLNQSLNILKTEKKHQTLLAKNSQLIRVLLQMIPAYLVVLVFKNKDRNKNSGKGKSFETGLGNNSQLDAGEVNTQLPYSKTNSYSTLQINFFNNYDKLYQMLKEVKQSYTPPSKQQIKKNFNKGLQQSIKVINNVLLFINNNSSIINQPSHTNAKQQRLLWPASQTLSQLLVLQLKFMQLLHRKSSQDIYKVITILNMITMVNYSPTNPTNTPTPNPTIPTQQILTIYPECTNLYNNNFSELLVSRLKILRAVLQLVSYLADMTPFPSTSCNLGLNHNMFYHSQILHTTAHILIQVNYYTRNSNYYLGAIIYAIYDHIMRLLIRKQSIVPLYLYTHLIMNNLKILMQWNHNKYQTVKGNPIPQSTNPTLLTIPALHPHTTSYMSSLAGSSSPQARLNYNQLVLLQTILTQISNLFEPAQLSYFLKLYDWNFMEEDICLSSIRFLYQFIEDEDNQGRQEYELFRRCLVVINHRIELFLQQNQTSSDPSIHTNTSHTQQDQRIPPTMSMYQAPKKQRKQFYQLKKKQYLSIVEKINKKPKQIFKIIEHFNKNGELEMKEDYIQKIVRILKKSVHVDQKAMIDVVASNVPEAEEILQKYIDMFYSTTSPSGKTKDSSYNGCSLEHYLRSIISNFFLTGQSQQIIRYLDKTTQYYHKHQPSNTNPFKTSDSVYTFANAIILLNSDQHNPKNPNKMSVDAFMKICENINDGSNLPADVVRETYRSIKESEIYTFRNRYKMEKISLDCWLDIVNDYSSVDVGYYDDQMADVCREKIQHLHEDDNHHAIYYNAGFKQFANQLLLSVIDQKQTQKLQLMVQRFEYDDRKFDCQIIEKIRGMIANKKHIAMHILQKIFEQADFVNKKIDEKMYSYCWLATGIIENFYQTLSYSKIAQYLLKSWRIGFEAKDNLHIRQNLEFKMIKKLIKENKKKQTKKSIINMFSKFLSSKNSQSESDQKQAQSPTLNTSRSGSSLHSTGSSTRKKANITNSSFTILKMLMETKQSRTRSAETILFSLRKQESRRFEEFMSCLFLIFHFVYGEETASQIKKEREFSIGLGAFNGEDYEFNSRINGECIDILINLLNDFYCIAQPHKIGLRITSLKSKNLQKYQLVYSYCQYWTLKILFTWSMQNYKNYLQQQSVTHQQMKQLQKLQTQPKKRPRYLPSVQIEDKIKQLYSKCAPLLSKINSDILQQLVKILDVNLKDLSAQKLIQQVGIAKQIIAGLKTALETHGIKPQFIDFVDMKEADRDKDKITNENKNQNKHQNKQALQQTNKQEKLYTKSKSQPQKQIVTQEQDLEKLMGSLRLLTSKSEQLVDKQSLNVQEITKKDIINKDQQIQAKNQEQSAQTQNQLVNKKENDLDDDIEEQLRRQLQQINRPQQNNVQEKIDENKKTEQGLIQIKYIQEKEQKKQNNSNTSQQQLVLPIYML